MVKTDLLRLGGGGDARLRAPSNQARRQVFRNGFSEWLTFINIWRKVSHSAKLLVREGGEERGVWRNEYIQYGILLKSRLSGVALRIGEKHASLHPLYEICMSSKFV